jgi:hypothetical protein
MKKVGEMELKCKKCWKERKYAGLKRKTDVEESKNSNRAVEETIKE